MHKVFLFLNQILYNNTPYLIFINGDTQTLSLGSMTNSSSFYAKSSSNNLWFSSSNDLATSMSANSLISDSLFNNNNLCSNSSIMGGAYKILCTKTQIPFHYVLNNRNIQGLSVYDPHDNSVEYRINEDEHENGAIVITPNLGILCYILFFLAGHKKFL